ncbi:MAG: ATP-binding cassette domain-containing protein [Deltaproteobacteria bacterium]|nr:ATP-binding cassette domain-containing protein [Deltaproteobacteria bacterium]
MIAADSLTKNYGPVRALGGVSFEISANEVVGLLGPNGAGKTTLMKVLTGYLHPSGGTATIDGIEVVEDPLTIQSKIGYLPENAPVYMDMLVQEYLMMIAELRELEPAKRVAFISEAVERTGLTKHLVRPIGELSKGYRQRVGLAQAILHQPKVLILDEPTSGLDPNQIVEIRALIRELAKTATVLLSTHILPEVELTCERVLIISEGEVGADARLEDLKVSDAAIVAVDAKDGVEQALSAIEGVSGVELLDKTHHPDVSSLPKGFSAYRVQGGGESICPEIHQVVNDKGWKLAELRRDTRNLEAVFRAVAKGRAA